MIIIGLELAVILLVLSIQTFVYKKSKDLITAIILLELVLLAIGILLVHLSVVFDDLMGSNLTLFLLPIAGSESAVAQALLIAYYPQRGSINLNS